MLRSLLLVALRNIRRDATYSLINVAGLTSGITGSPILISIIIASIVSWYLAKDWLESFVYRTEINLISFVLAGVVMMVITTITVSYHAIRSANANPAESLKYE